MLVEQSDMRASEQILGLIAGFLISGNEFIFPRIRTFVSHQPHRNMSLEQLQATLDEQKQNMPEGTYLSLCNLSKDVHELLAGKDKEIAEKDKEITEKDKEITKKDEQLWGAVILFSQLAGQVVSSS